MQVLDTTTSTTAQPAGAITVRTQWQRSLLTFALVLGPGLIVTTADNDAGAVSTYTQAGAQYGVHLVWLLLLLLPTTYFIQEMVARLGIATGQGHAAMIYKRFGKWWGVFSLVDLLFVNFLTLVTEFGGVSLAVHALGISPYIAVPVAAVSLFALVATGSYLRWERMTIFLCVLNIAWLGLARACHPDWSAVARSAALPTMPAGGLTSSLVFIVIGIVGTTIAPWQLFFQQSCVADKKLRFADLKWARLDTFIGAIAVVAFAGCMMLVGDLAFRQRIPFSDPGQMISALHVSPAFRIGFLLLMIDACILGATTISLSSSWAYGEVKGWAHSLQRKVGEAPGFYGVYLLCVAAAAAIVLIPKTPLQLIIVGVQVLAGVMLPSAVIFLQLLLNDKELLGERFANKPWNNVVNWTIIGVLFILSLVLAIQVIAPKLLPTG